MTESIERREDCDFESGGQRVAAWLYRPDISCAVKPPIIVMAHGFAGERRFRLPAYAESFADRGMAVLLFDYRHFGDSEGEPRNLVSHRRQHRDWLSAVDHAKRIDGVNGSRLGLWGSPWILRVAGPGKGLGRCPRLRPHGHHKENSNTK